MVRLCDGSTPDPNPNPSRVTLWLCTTLTLTRFACAMAAFFLLTFSMESYLLRFKRQWLGWLKSAPSVPSAYPQRTPRQRQNAHCPP